MILKKAPDVIDTHVGRRLSKLREDRGGSRQQLADAMEITRQQLYKYENGKNRVSPSRLQKAAEFLDVPISAFFDNMPPVAASGTYGSTMLHLHEIMRQLTRENQVRVVEFAQELEKMQKRDEGRLT